MTRGSILAPALGIAALLAGCSSNPTTLRAVPALSSFGTPIVAVLDTRTGAVAARELVAGTETTAFRRLVDGQWVTLAPALPYVYVQRRWAWHDGRALAFDDYGNTLLRISPNVIAGIARS